MFDKVLVSTDFSAPSQQLIHCVEEFRCLGVKEVVLAHVVDFRTAGMSMEAFRIHDEVKLNEERKRFENLGISVKTVVTIGNPAYEIVHFAEEEKASLIIIASHGEGIIKKVFLGSTVRDVVRLSTMPVLVEKFSNFEPETCAPTCSLKLQHVLIPVDFSDCSYQAIDLVKSFGKQVNNLTLLTIIEGAKSKADLYAQIKEVETKLEIARVDFQHLGINVDIRIDQGIPSHHILETAENTDSTLIVIPKRGKGTISELIIGSTAQSVTQRSKIPVLVLPCKNNQ
ncbi:MAG: universal stress protein [Candidatus Atribacteria bacterium]|nr:universal stress protein [Candidatus Atribacteria bacterium]